MKSINALDVTATATTATTRIIDTLTGLVVKYNGLSFIVKNVRMKMITVIS